jgi:hypothetical protein
MRVVSLFQMATAEYRGRGPDGETGPMSATQANGSLPCFGHFYIP